MKFLIVGDLHGQKPKIYFRNFDAIIAPGDFCSDAPRVYIFRALKERLQNPNTQIEWYDIIGKEKASNMIEKSLIDGRATLEYLNSFGVPVYIVPGNWDWTAEKDSDWAFLKKDHYKRLVRDLTNVIDTNHKIIDIGGYQLIGYGVSSGPEYPRYKEELERLKPKELTERRKRYEEDYNMVNSLFEKAPKPQIFLSHNVPFNTPLDKITDKKSPRCGYHYGSLLAREMIEKHQPLVCIGGHMHEHFCKCRIGKTICINSGFGSNVNVWMELEKDKIKKLEFYHR